ncbi:hypothetical protein Ddye_017451 [Dipteronia dyeriana]|uniref:Uncharacterized protein n=1 Tax=Dipteronia dyeriana TaxID=168575 RepID=A0AAD9U9I1_9ROSI|nr:hypothetical protein Ddye_017451 [Dipteronia dyeriana]
MIKTSLPWIPHRILKGTYSPDLSSSQQKSYLMDPTNSPPRLNKSSTGTPAMQQFKIEYFTLSTRRLIRSPTMSLNKTTSYNILISRSGTCIQTCNQEFLGWMLTCTSISARDTSALILTTKKGKSDVSRTS